MNFMFAQAFFEGPRPGMPVAVILLIGAFALIIAGLVFTTIFSLGRQRQERREWEHTERMQMIQMGMPVPPQEAAWTKAILCGSIGVIVPFIAFVCTSIAYDRPGAPDELWIVPALVSGASVLSASLLAGHLFGSKGRPIGNTNAERIGNMKMVNDPDAFDVVGSRG